MQFAIAMDLGTSGFRAQAVELPSGRIVSTAITMRHPLPGANVMDHLHFALELGREIVAAMMVRAVNRVLGELRVPAERVVRFAVCGNPIQLSLFQGIEIRDLAYAGTGKLESLGVVPPKREAAIMEARRFPGLALPGDCDVLIPPAVRHEVGADALAMMIQTGMLEEDETALATDFGTNAEVALFHNGSVITGSTAAGPALEGQQIDCGMLAAPGAVCDLEPSMPHHRMILLDAGMLPVRNALVDLGRKGVMDAAGLPRPAGITGTGTIALVNQAMEAGLIALPRIRTGDRRLHLGEDLYLTEEDLVEAGKAFGAVRAGHITLCQEAGIPLEAVGTMYMSGASGTYVDAIKALKLGLVPPRVKKIYQVGNTSLAMARELAVDPDNLGRMADLAAKLKNAHCMFAASRTFKKIYILELSYWTEGMPMALYRDFLKKYGFPDLPGADGVPQVIRTVKRDIDDFGRYGLTTITDIGGKTALSIQGCTSCLRCVRECPAGAISIEAKEGEPAALVLDESLCNGTACRRCERVCPVKVFELDRFFRLNRTAKRKRTESVWPCSG